MPVLLNPRWEAFAQAVAVGMAEPAAGWTQAKAYEASGYKATGDSAAVNACRLLKYAKPVVQRINEIRQAQSKQTKVTIEGITQRLDLASRIAEEDRIPNALVAAEAAKAKINGLIVEKQEQGKPGDFSTPQTTDELAQAMLTQAGASNVTQDMKAMAIAELERHARALASIAAGESSSDLAMPSTSKRQSSQLSA